MKISISGAQCTGKTTLIANLKEKPQFKDYEVYKSPTRILSQQYGMNFHYANEKLQLATLILQMENAYKQGDGIFDRSIIDNLAYYEYFKVRGQTDILDNVHTFMYDCAYRLLKNIDIHFLLLPEIPLKDDGVREVNEGQRIEVTNIIRKMLTDWDIEYIILSGTIEQRASAVMEYMFPSKSIL